MLFSKNFHITILLSFFLIVFGLATSQYMYAAQLDPPLTKPVDVPVPSPDLELISRVINRPWGIDVDNKVASVLSTSEFALMELNDPTRPRIVSYVTMAGTASQNRHQGQLQEVLLQGNYAYAIWSCTLEMWVTSCEGGGRLEIIDIADATAPKLVGSLETESRMLNLTVLDSMIHLRLDQEQIAIVDINNPGSPQLRSVTQLSGRSFSYDHRLKVYNNNGQKVLYTAKSNSINYAVGLVIFDVTNPDAPTQLSTFEPAGIYAQDLDLVDTGNNQYVYLMDSNIGLRVIDVTDPMNPVQVNTYDFGIETSYGTKAFPLAIIGDYIYVPIVLAGSGTTKELHILDISDPTTPVLADTYNTPYLAEVTDITGADSLLFITDFAGGIQVLDITNPTVPVEIGKQAILEGYTFSDIAIDGQYLYIAGPDALYIYDAFNPLSPQEIARFETSFYTSGVLVNNGTALVVDRDDGLIVLDVTNPASPTQIGITNGSLPAAENMVLEGTLGESAYAFVGSSCNQLVCPSAKLNIIDLSNLTSPVMTEVTSANRAINDMSLADSTIYAATDNDFMIWDISSPLTPNLLSDVPFGSPKAQAITVIDNYAYIATSWVTHTLQTWDVSDPTTPLLINTFFTDTAYEDLSFDQEYLYATTRNDQLLIFDLSDPTNPILADETALPVETINYEHFNELAIQGDFVYVLHEGLSIWHHRNESIGHTRDAWNRPFSNAVVTANTDPMETTGLTGSFAPGQGLSGTYELSAELSGYSTWPSNRLINFDDPSSIGNEDFYMLGLPVEEQALPNVSTNLIYFDTMGLTTDVFVPAGAVNETMIIRFQPTMAFSNDEKQRFVGNAFNLELLSNTMTLRDDKNYVLNASVDVTIHYSDLGLQVVDEKTLQLMMRQGDAWVAVDEACSQDSVNYTRDEVNNTLQVSICQPGEFALFGEGLETIFLPIISR